MGGPWNGVVSASIPNSSWCRAASPSYPAALRDSENGVPQAAHVLHNFDIPIGLVREGERQGHVMAGQTQWSVIGDHKNRRYYYWTEHNRRMRLVDLNKLNFGNGEVQRIPLDAVQVEDIEDRPQDFS
jgi:choloylglycine hydrolase